jgi:hypothetical protein
MPQVACSSSCSSSAAFVGNPFSHMSHQWLFPSSSFAKCCTTVNSVTAGRPRQRFGSDTDPDPAFSSIPIPIQVFGRPKIEKNLQLKKKFLSRSKTTIYLSLGLHKGRPSYRSSLHTSALKSEHLALLRIHSIDAIYGTLSPKTSTLINLHAELLKNTTNI